jgi:hypothetical protein
MDQVIWGAGAIDSSAARMSLQCIQLIASMHMRTTTGREIGFSTILIPQYGQQNLFVNTIYQLLYMIIFPGSADSGIAWDRVDACANAFITLVALDVRSFENSAHELMTQRFPQHQDALRDCFRKLTTSNGVDMTKVDRANRQKFVTNMRTFVNDIRPLVQYR